MIAAPQQQMGVGIFRRENLPEEIHLGPEVVPSGAVVGVDQKKIAMGHGYVGRVLTGIDKLAKRARLDITVSMKRGETGRLAARQRKIVAVPGSVFAAGLHERHSGILPRADY